MLSQFRKHRSDRGNYHTARCNSCNEKLERANKIYTGGTDYSKSGSQTNRCKSGMRFFWYHSDSKNTRSKGRRSDIRLELQMSALYFCHLGDSHGHAAK